ncbi:hypothetical protein LDENG_00181350 [Lucifuga dentata]|nr:hypothetical protein LDENG_00181350 [Lucifuga dentata]
MRYVISAVCSGSSLESPHSWTCLENLQREASRRRPNQMPDPPQLASFNAKSVSSTLSTPPYSCASVVVACCYS